MAPKFAPKVWKRPHTSIYNDNYRFGNSLYSEQISDIERKYNESLASTRLGSDRLDLGLSTFSDSQLVGANALAKQRSDRAHENYLAERIRNSISMPRSSATIHDSDVRRLQHSPSFDSYSTRLFDLEESAARLRRSASRPRMSRPPRPESHYSAAFELDSAKPSDNFWMERWYQNSLRSVRHDLYPPSLLKAMHLVPV